MRPILPIRRRRRFALRVATRFVSVAGAAVALLVIVVLAGCGTVSTGSEVEPMPDPNSSPPPSTSVPPIEPVPDPDSSPSPSTSVPPVEPAVPEAPAEDPAATPTLALEEGQHPAVAGAFEAMQDVRSFDFIEQGASSMVPLSRYSLSATGTFQSPDRLSKRMEIQWAGEPIAVEAVRIGDVRYLTHPVLQEWIPYHEGLINGNDRTMEALFISPMDTLLDVLYESGRFESRAVETLDGVDVEHYVWSTEFEEYPQKDTRRTVDIFIGTEDSLVRSLVVRDAWTHDWCDPSETCPDILNEPGSDAYVLEFSFPGSATPVAAPPVDRDIVSSPVGPMALFTNSQIPFSIRYPAEWKPLWPNTWTVTAFRDYEDPHFEWYKRNFTIWSEFVDDVWVAGRYYPCVEDHPGTDAAYCDTMQRIHEHLVKGEFSAQDEVDYQQSEHLRWGSDPWRRQQSRQEMVGGDGWSAQVVEWTESFNRAEIRYMQRRRLTHVQKVPTDRPECTDGATHCYVVTNFTYWGDAEYADSTRALADYSFSTLE